MNPLILNFDPPLPGTTPAKDGITRLPKLYQGAPYDQTLKLKATETGEYRDFSSYDEIIMQCVVQQGQPAFLTLSKTSGSIVGLPDGLQIKFPGSALNHVKVPVLNAKAINEMYFLHSIILIEGGVEVERFAQGHGFLVAAIARPA